LTTKLNVDVPLVDVAWQHHQVRTEIDRDINQLLNDPTCDGTEFVSQLESDFARRLGTGMLAVSTHSGTAAEFLILRALGIGLGDEVITVPNSDLATTAAISHTGATPVLVDIDPCTYTVDPAKIKAAITVRTRAIVPVHMYGLPAKMDKIRHIAKEHGLKVIEDSAIALGAEYRGAMIGTLGDAAFFSFAPRKVLGGIGCGGMVTTRDPELAYKVRLLKGAGLEPEQMERPIGERHKGPGFDHYAEGYNLRLDAVQAIVIRAKLARLDEWRALRQQVADRYSAQLTNMPGIVPPYVPAHMRHAWRNYVIRVPERDRVRAGLLENGITTAIFYCPPVHLQPVYQSFGLGPGSFPMAEDVAGSLLCLPMYPGLTEEKIDMILASLTDATRGASL
jgi:dTDP-4-amino-4,6-dideoxygalactose transaminase